MTVPHDVKIGVIGGTGLYKLDHLEIVDEIYPDTVSLMLNKPFPRQTDTLIRFSYRLLSQAVGQAVIENSNNLYTHGPQNSLSCSSRRRPRIQPIGSTLSRKHSSVKVHWSSSNYCLLSGRIAS